jgi:hypothetical protein
LTHHGYESCDSLKYWGRCTQIMELAT